MSVPNNHGGWWLINFKFALVLWTFWFEVGKELVLDKNVKDKDTQGLSGFKTVQQFYGEKLG